MKEKLILLAIAFISTNSFAQTAVSAAGGEAGNVSYTVGQPFYTQAYSDIGSISAGVQQTYLISIIDGIENNIYCFDLEAYPNPTTNKLHLTVGNSFGKNVCYTLTTITGKTIREDSADGENTTIDMSGLTPSVYILHVLIDNTNVRTFKIVKQ